jgi:hypothetical protein
MPRDRRASEVSTAIRLVLAQEGAEVRRSQPHAPWYRQREPDGMPRRRPADLPDDRDGVSLRTVRHLDSTGIVTSPEIGRLWACEPSP